MRAVCFKKYTELLFNYSNCSDAAPAASLLRGCVSVGVASPMHDCVAVAAASMLRRCVAPAAA